MHPLLLALATALIGIVVGLGLRRGPGRGPGAALATGAAAFAVLVVSERLAAALPRAAAGFPVLLAVAAALVLWGAVAALAFRGVRRRDLFWIVPFGLFSLVGLAGGDPSTGGALVTMLPVVARWRWPRETGQRALGWAILGAVLAPLLAFLPVPGGRAADGVPGFATIRYVAWARELAGLYLLLALPGLLRNWSLSIRRVSRRLVVLLLLSGLVPVLLLSLMWGFTTVLGARAERALFATRQIEQAGGDLRAALRIAQAAPGRAPLLAVAAAHAGWPGLRLWRDGARVHGGPVTDEAALAGWPDSLPQSGLVIAGGAGWLGARARGPSGTAWALAPIEQVLDADVGPRLGARLELQADFSPDSSDGALADVADGDSLPPGLDSLARRLPAVGPTDRGVHLSFGGQRVTAGEGFSVTAGHALLDGIVWQGRRWERTREVLAADLRWRDAALGLYRTVGENPMSLLSLFFIELLALLLVMVAAADFGMVRALGRSITAAVQALGHGAGRLEAGDLDHRIAVEGDDELWDVAGAFNRMAVGLERGRQLEIERQRIESELGLARRIQARLLPPGPPALDGLDLAGTSESAREVGGDYYDFLPLGDGRVALVIADVSGKGVGAALLMSAFRASLMSQDLRREPVAAVLARLNHFLHRSVEPGRFVTAFLAVLDAADGRMLYSNAGHNAPLVVSADGAVQRLEAGGLILGIFEEAAYETGEVTLAPGDRLVLFTDGVTEAMNEQDEQWQEERLVELVRASAALDSATLIRRIVEAVRAFEGARGASDDVTLIVARRSGG
jgi:serine phosphatase RsbU (regulator of sigma subunit)